jgi:hypothetical protein
MSLDNKPDIRDHQAHKPHDNVHAEGPGCKSQCVHFATQKVGTSFAPGHQAKMSLNLEDEVPLKKLTLNSFRE